MQILSPMNHHAGTAILPMMKKITEQMIRVLGKRTRYAPVTPAIAPEAPTAG